MKVRCIENKWYNGNFTVGKNYNIFPHRHRIECNFLFLELELPNDFVNIDTFEFALCKFEKEKEMLLTLTNQELRAMDILLNCNPCTNGCIYPEMQTSNIDCDECEFTEIKNNLLVQLKLL